MVARATWHPGLVHLWCKFPATNSASTHSLVMEMQHVRGGTPPPPLNTVSPKALHKLSLSVKLTSILLILYQIQEMSYSVFRRFMVTD
jgi:hypothetical protein